MVCATKRVKIFICLAVLVCFSCQDEGYMVNRLDSITAEADTNPQRAIERFDSLSIDTRNCSEELAMKYQLVRIRLYDKAYIRAKSDNMVKEMVDYYERHGNDREKQEAYYYAGSVYRDLNDTSLSLEYFLKAEETAENSDGCDSLMLRNTYSNLFYLYRANMLDLDKASQYAKKEYDISRKIGKTEFVCLLHLGTSLASSDSVKQAHDIYKHTLDSIYSNSLICNNAEKLALLQKNNEVLSALLLNLSLCNDSVNARRCVSLIEKTGIGYEDDAMCQAYGYYYNMLGENDSSIYAFNRVLENGNDTIAMYSVTETLFKMCDYLGRTSEAYKYAKQYINLSDALDWGTSQRLTAKTHNKFQYQRDKDVEQNIVSENNGLWLFVKITLIAIPVIIVVVCVFAWRRIKSYIERLRKSYSRIREQEKDKRRLKLEFEQKGKEADDELTQQRKRKKVLLQTMSVYTLSKKPKEVIDGFVLMADKRKSIDKADWRDLFVSVELLYPDFQSKLLRTKKNLSELEMQALYLMCAGLDDGRIMELLSVARSTVWRWRNDYNEL